jgi:hypothetical protein
MLENLQKGAVIARLVDISVDHYEIDRVFRSLSAHKKSEASHIFLDLKRELG